MTEESSQRLPPHERLKSRKIIDLLFKEGQSLFSFPIKLLYHKIDLTDYKSSSQFLFGATVPKRLHKQANTRNLLKRRIREAYRKNKVTLAPSSKEIETYALMYILVDKNIAEYQTIEKSIIKLHQKLADKIRRENDEH